MGSVGYVKVCSIQGCQRPSKARDMCDMHYARWRRNGDPNESKLTRMGPKATCVVDGCDKPATGRAMCNTHYQRWLRRQPATGDKQCVVDGCTTRAVSRGMCNKHYFRWRRYGDPTVVKFQRGINKGLCQADGCQLKAAKAGYCARHYYEFSPPARRCDVDGCDNAHYSKGMCRRHYNRWKKHGDPQADIPLRVGKLPEAELVVNEQGYVLEWDPTRRKRVQQHRLVMERHLGRKLRAKENVHHINGDRADNRLDNLELWSVAQPPGQRVADRVEWAREILKTYEAEMPKLKRKKKRPAGG